MRTVKERAARYAQSDLPILIRGETGVGKDVVARGIHRLSNRSKGPFVVVNCAALASHFSGVRIFRYRERCVHWSHGQKWLV